MRHAFLQRTRQRGVRSDFEEKSVAALEQRIDRGGEAHRQADVSPPVAGGKIIARTLDARHRRKQAERRGLRFHFAERAKQFIAHGLHLVAVKGIAHAQGTAENRALLELRSDRLDGIGIARERDGVRAVKRGNRDTPGPRCDDLLRLRPRQRGRDHPAVFAREIHAATALKNYARRFAQAEHARHVRRGDFAHAVSDNGRGPDAPRLPQCGEGDLQRKDRRLRDRGLIHARKIFIARHLFDQRPVCEFAQNRVAFLDLRAEHRFLLQQFAPHRPPLRPLAGKNEDRRLIVRGVTRRKSGPVFAGDEGLEFLHHFLTRIRRDTETMRMTRAMCAGGETNVSEAQAAAVAAFGKERGIFFSEATQRFLAARREREQVRAIRWRLVGHEIDFLRRRRLKDRVRIGATESEGVDAGDWQIGSVPEWSQFLRDAELQLCEINVRVRVPEMQTRRNPSMLQRERGLDDACDAGARFHVADVCLHGPDHERRPGIAAVAQRRAERGRLDRIADERPRAVRLDILHL